jgi:hypothetical protein
MTADSVSAAVLTKQKETKVTKQQKKSLFSLLPSVLALSPLIQGFFGAQIITFSAEFALRRRCAGTLLAGTRLGPRKFLPLP